MGAEGLPGDTGPAGPPGIARALAFAPPDIRTDRDPATSPPWWCSFGTDTINVAEGDRLQVSVQATLNMLCPASGCGGTTEYWFAAGYRDATGVETVGPYVRRRSIFSALDRPESASLLSDALTAGDYDVGVCISDRSDFDYSVAGNGIAFLIPAAVP